MNTLFKIGLGIAIGAGFAWVLSNRNEPPPPFSQQISSNIAPSPATPTATGQRATERASPPSLANLSQIRSEFEQSLALYELLSPRDSHEIQQLIEEAKRTIFGRDYVAATSIMYGRLAELDFERALDQANNSPDRAKQSWIRSIFHALARLDLDRAIAAARDLPRSQQRVAGRAILNARDDLALEQRQAMADDLKVDLPIDALSEDLANAWQHALQLANPQARMAQLNNIATQWGAQDPRAALEASTALPPGMRMGIQTQIVSQWASRDPDGAWQWVASIAHSRSQEMFTSAVIGSLAQLDLDRAKTIAESLSGKRRAQAMRSIVVPWAKQDPEAVLVWLEQHEAGRTRLNLINQLTAAMALEDPAFIERLESQLTPQEQQMVDMTTFTMLAYQDPQAATERIDQIEDPERRRQAASNLVRQWAQNDRTGALTWVDKQPLVDRPPLYNAVTRAWAQWDVEAALAFARGLRDSDSRDQAILGVAQLMEDIDLMEETYRDLDSSAAKSQLGSIIHYKFRASHPQRAATYKPATTPDSTSIRLRTNR